MHSAEKTLRDHLKSLLDQCNPEQINLFNRMYKSADEIPYSKIDWAISQCERTIEKNKQNES